MKVKVCGLSTAKQVKTCVDLGANYCGFILNYPKSHRFIQLEKAKELTSLEKKDTKYVGVLVNTKNEELEKFSRLNIDYFQIYGNYNEKLISNIKLKFNKKIIVAIQVKNKKDILIAYEPVWAIGSGLVPKDSELFRIVDFIKSKAKGAKVLYGGSVNSKNITRLKDINNIDGFLIGGASQISNNFIDIIKKTYN